VAPNKLKDKVVIVTGGGTGIGRAASMAFARLGASVLVNYSKSHEAADETVNLIIQEGGRAIPIKADVSKESEAGEMMRVAEKEFGGLNYLVNNAGWSTRIPHHQLDDLTDEIWDRTLNTNLRGVFYCVRQAVPYLKKQEGSAIVNIASVAGLGGVGSSMIYAASKGAVITMTKSLARALAPDVRVNAVAPGFVRTRFAGWTEDAFAAGESITPLQRLATCDDIADGIVFLATQPAITGEILVLDGGLQQLGRR
jgi:3-oxoacyl-[acyl-carrier protein] reductase